MIQWFIFVLLIGEGVADLTCYDNGYGRYYPRDKDKCRAKDFNAAFNNGDNLMNGCGGIGTVRTVFGCNMCSLPCVWGTRIFGWVACLCLFFLPLLHSSKP